MNVTYDSPPRLTVRSCAVILPPPVPRGVTLPNAKGAKLTWAPQDMPRRVSTGGSITKTPLVQLLASFTATRLTLSVWASALGRKGVWVPNAHAFSSAMPREVLLGASSRFSLRVCESSGRLYPLAGARALVASGYQTHRGEPGRRAQPPHFFFLARRPLALTSPRIRRRERIPVQFEDFAIRCLSP